MENEEVKKEGIDNTASGMRIGKLTESMPKVQNVQELGKYLKTKYFPELDLDQIGDKLEVLTNNGLSLNEIVEKIENGELDLRNVPEKLSNLENKEQNQEEGPSLED